MRQQHIMFDLDDTLIYCNQYFEWIIEQFAKRLEEMLAHPDITVEIIKQKQVELDLAGVEKYGFLADRFPQSLVETYQYFTRQIGHTLNDEEAHVFLRLGLSVYDHEIKPYPYMVETLNELKYQGHLLYIYTGGDRAIQLSKIKKAGLQAYFADRIYVAQYKTLDFLQSLLAERKLSLTDTWMIGNSERTDIVPALEAGINSIYIPRDNEWDYNNVDIKVEPKGAYYQLKSLREIPSAIHNYLRTS